MAWSTPRTFTAGEIITAAILNAHLRDQLRYLKGLDGVPTIESGLTISNASGNVIPIIDPPYLLCYIQTPLVPRLIVQ